MSDITSQVHPSSQPPDEAGEITNQPSVRPSADGSDFAPPSLALPKQPRVRLWPAIAVVALLWLVMKTPAWIMDHYGDPNLGVPIGMLMFFGMFFGPMVAGGLFSIWWLFFSRVGWGAKLLVLVSCAAFAAGAYFLYVPETRFFMLVMLALPWVMTVWVGWLLLGSFLRWPLRVAGLLVVILLGFLFFALLRLDGITGGIRMELAWRWGKTAEDKFLAELAARKKSADVENLADAKIPVVDSGDWPAFRGEQRDSHLKGVRIARDWDKNPPKELWRHRVGPGWGSFAVIGDRLYTQEQRGEIESVVCYSVKTGDELWAHNDTARFTEVVSGAGPRATPTFHEGKIYTYGGKGTLNCLDALTGKPHWTRNVPEDVGANVPVWGFASSPLVAHGLVTVFAGGDKGKSVAAYDTATGEPKWTAAEGLLSYSSPHLAKIGGVEQILIATDIGLIGLEPMTGAVLWKHNYPTEGQWRSTQPTVLSSTDVLLGSANSPTRRIQIDHNNDSWSDKATWTSKAIKQYFNDLVVHGEYIYGFDTGMFVCVRLQDGKGMWRERGYGNGQVLLLEDQGLLLIAAETGEVALAEAKPDGLNELGRFKAFEGKTWNHPVVAHGKLFVRNGEEMACYQLTEETGK